MATEPWVPLWEQLERQLEDANHLRGRLAVAEGLLGHLIALMEPDVAGPLRARLEGMRRQAGQELAKGRSEDDGKEAYEGAIGACDVILSSLADRQRD